MKELSVIIVNYNGEKYIERCCDNLLKYLPDIDSEIILVDNHSTDGSVEKIKKGFENINIIKLEKNYGPAGARNIGVNNSRGKYLLFLDHDTFIKKNTISIMMRAFEDEKVGIVGCKLWNEDGTHQPSAKRFPTLSREIFSAFLLNRIFKKSNLSYVIQSAQTVEVDWVSGACLMMRREVFISVGGFDGNYFYGAEEADLCYRTKRAGWKVLYVPEAEAVHVAYGSNLVVTSQVYSNPLKAKIIFFKKHYPEVKISFLKWIIFIQVINETVAWGLVYFFSIKRDRASIAIKERLIRLRELVSLRL